MAVNTDFDYKPRNADEYQGFATINLNNLNITFDMNLVTKLDEVTGDYYPYTDITGYNVNTQPEEFKIKLEGGTPLQ